MKKFKQYPFRDKSLSYKERVADLISRLTLDEKIKMLSTHHYAVERLGIGEWFIGIECARGYVSHDNDKPSTVFPQPIGMASTFDRELMQKIGEAASDEFRAYYNKCGKGGLMVWGPTVDMERDPRWGRTEEAYGEDPFLTGEMTAAYTKGLRGNGSVMKTIPTLKHFCADNNEKNRASCSANLDPRTKHEYYYAAFKPAVVKGGAYSLMAAYNELSGVPAIMNPELESIVKAQWGLGFVVSDGGDFSQNVTAHKYVHSHAEAFALCIKAGCDVMTDCSELVHASAYEALKLGLITEADIDKAIGNSLDGRFRLGEFDGGTEYDSINDNIINCEAFKALNLQAAKESVTLLKNDGILPLKNDRKIALIGTHGERNFRDWYTGYSDYLVSVKEGLEKRFGKENVAFDNGYDIIAIKSKANGKYLTVNDDGTASFSADKITDEQLFEYHDWDFDVVNLFSIAKQKFLRFESSCTLGEKEVFSWFTWETLHPREYNGYLMFENRTHDALEADENGLLCVVKRSTVTDRRLFEIEVVSRGTERAAKLAGECSTAVVCVGNHPMQVARECYDRPDITLPKAQTALVKAAFEANPNTVELIVSSYPFAVCYEKENLHAIVYTSHAGAELGNAVAAVLSGDYNPAGRTPLTWYKTVYDLPDITDYDIISNDTTYQYFKGDVCYPFGYGLSYSEFEYEAVSVRKAANKLIFSVKVANTSDRDGDEVVQIYYKALSPRVKRPLKKLCGFERVHIKAHTTANVEIEVPEQELEFYDVTREKFCLESGAYEFMIGASSEDIRLRTTVAIKGEKIPPRELRLVTKSINYDEKKNALMLWSKDKEAHFMKLDGWYGYLLYKDVGCEKPSYFEVRASAYEGTAGKISIHIDSPDGKEIGSVEIPPSMSIDEFGTFSAKLSSVSGRHDIYLILGGGVSVLDFRFK